MPGNVGTLSMPAGATFGPASFPGLVAWYAAERVTGLANRAFLPQWNDLSGNGNHLLTGPNTINQPVFVAGGQSGFSFASWAGHPYIEFIDTFPTSGAYMFTAPFPLAQPCTVLCVFIGNPSTTNQVGVLVDGLTANSMAVLLNQLRPSNTPPADVPDAGGDFRINAGTLCPIHNNGSSPYLLPQSWVVGGGVFNGPASFPWYNNKGIGLMASGSISSVTSSSITVQSANGFQNNNPYATSLWVGHNLNFVSGPGAGSTYTISSITGGPGNVINISGTWAATPVAGKTLWTIGSAGNAGTAGAGGLYVCATGGTVGNTYGNQPVAGICELAVWRVAFTPAQMRQMSKFWRAKYNLAPPL